MPVATVWVERLARSTDVLFNIDLPSGPTESDVYSLECAGWVAGQGAEVEKVEIRTAGQCLREVPLVHREDVSKYLAKAWKSHRPADRTGFHTRFSVIGLPTDAEVNVDAVFASGRRLTLATMRVTHSPLLPGAEPATQPLLVMALGRSGTTWMMRLLRYHPEIVVYGDYPYEIRAAQYWMHMLRALSEEPVEADEAPESFVTRSFEVRPFPYSFLGGGLSTFASSQAHLSHLATYAQAAIDELYRGVGQGEEGRLPRFYAEKANLYRFIPGIFNEVYGSARNVVLIRDPRDIIASTLAFNKRRGWDDLGRSEVSSDLEYVDLIGEWATHLVATANALPTSVTVRYEDLVQSPADALRSVLEYCGVDAGPATIDSMVRETSTLDPAMREHTTATDPRASVGRWRRDLSPALQERCTERLGDALRLLGYEA